MDYLTNYYKNKATQLQEQIKFLKKKLYVLREDLEVERGQHPLVDEPFYKPEAVYWGGTGGIKIEKIDPKLLPVLGLGGIGTLEKFVGEPMDRERMFKRTTSSADGKIRVSEPEPSQPSKLRLSKTEVEAPNVNPDFKWRIGPATYVPGSPKPRPEVVNTSVVNQLPTDSIINKTVPETLAKTAVNSLGHGVGMLATDMPGFVAGSEGIGEPIGSRVGASEKRLAAQFNLQNYVDTSEKGLVYKIPAGTITAAATAPYIRAAVSTVPRLLGAGARVLPALDAAGSIAAGESLAALGPYGLALAATPAAAYGIIKAGEKGIKSYYGVSDEDYNKQVAREEEIENKRKQEASDSDIDSAIESSYKRLQGSK